MLKPIVLLLSLCGIALALPISAAPSLDLQQQENPRDSLSRHFEARLASSAPLTLTCDELGGDAERHEVERAAASTHSITLHGLKAATKYRCRALSSGLIALRSSPVEFVTAPLPFDLKPPRISVASDDVARTGYILYNYGLLKRPWRVDSRYLVVLDPRGNVRWYWSGDGGGDIDVSFLGDGRFLFAGYHSYSVPPTIVDLDKNVIFKDASAPVSPYESANSWNHDAGLSVDGTSILYLTYESREWSGPVIREIDLNTGDVLWHWSGILDGYDQGYLEAGTSGSDPYHGNAVSDVWEDGRRYVYLGMRNNSAFIKIDYVTGEVVWRLGVGGDFTLLENDGTPATDDRWFFDQHDAKMQRPGLFVVHDNGTSRSQYGGVNYSRALQLEIDESAMTARIKLEYTEPNWVESIWGGYDVYPNGYSMVAMAHCWVCGVSHNASVVELNPAAQVVWRADFANEKEHVYRSERIDGCALFNNREMCKP